MARSSLPAVQLTGAPSRITTSASNGFNGRLRAAPRVGNWSNAVSGELLLQCNRLLKMTTAAGELWSIYQQGSGSEESVSPDSLTALQIGGPPAKSCKIEVYGVNFGFNTSDIKLSGRRADAVKAWLERMALRRHG